MQSSHSWSHSHVFDEGNPLAERNTRWAVALTVVMVIRFHQSVLTTLIAVGLLAILWHRPRARAPEAGSEAA